LEKIVTTKELGQYLKLSKATIYKLAATGEIPGFRLGNSWRFNVEKIIESMNKKENTKSFQSLEKN